MKIVCLKEHLEDLPKEILDVLALIPAFLVDVGIGEDDGAAAVAVDLRPGLEDEVVDEADVALVEQSVLRLEETRQKFEWGTAWHRGSILAFHPADQGSILFLRRVLM